VGVLIRTVGPNLFGIAPVIHNRSVRGGVFDVVHACHGRPSSPLNTRTGACVARPLTRVVARVEHGRSLHIPCGLPAINKTTTQGRLGQARSGSLPPPHTAAPGLAEARGGEKAVLPPPQAVGIHPRTLVDMSASDRRCRRSRGTGCRRRPPGATHQPRRRGRWRRTRPASCGGGASW
jgi:hypothetical protein